MQLTGVVCLIGSGKSGVLLNEGFGNYIMIQVDLFIL